MLTDAAIGLPQLYAFLFVLARVSGAFIFVPIPGLRTGPDLARIILSLSMAVALFGRCPPVDVAHMTMPLLIGYLIIEAGFGIAVGVAVSFVLEVISLGAQILNVQAGFGHASTIDPMSNADSTVLILMAQLTGGLLFFA